MIKNLYHKSVGCNIKQHLNLKTMRKLSVVLIIILVSIAIYYYKNSYGLYAYGENDSFKIKVEKLSK